MTTVNRRYIANENKFNSTGTRTSETVYYIINDATDEAAASAALLAALPDRTAERMAVSNMRITEHLGTNDWYGEVQYTYTSSGVSVSGSDNEESFSFDTGSNTETVITPLSSRVYGNNEIPTPKFINVDEEGNVRGIEVPAPAFEFTETHYLSNSYVSAAYKRGLANLRGAVNNARFRAWNPGEVMFMGASGSRSGSEDWQITFRFSVRLNENNKSVGGVSVDAEGWQVVEVKPKKKQAVSAGAIMPEIDAVFVHTVHPKRDFAALGI